MQNFSTIIELNCDTEIFSATEFTPTEVYTNIQSYQTADMKVNIIRTHTHMPEKVTNQSVIN